MFSFFRRSPRIHYYAAALNEAKMLPHMLRHYEQWVERFVIYDSGSTDGSLEFLRGHPQVEVRAFEWIDPQSTVLSLRYLHNTCWTESRDRADWVIMADIDELLYHPDLAGYLRGCRKQGVTCIPALGYEMASRHFPAPGVRLPATMPTGMPTHMMSKLRLFDPNAVRKTNFSAGAHEAAPTGKVVYPERDELLLLHYKWLGLDHVRERRTVMRGSRRAGDLANDWGKHYNTPDDTLAAQLDRLLAASVDVVALGERAWREHREKRWWRVAPSPGAA